MNDKVILSVQEVYDVLNYLKNKVNDFVFGQNSLVEEILCCMFSQGHILITGAPGLAKTTLVKVFSALMGLDFKRIQFTPDLLPSDITGFEILNMDSHNLKRYFEFSKGPIFANLVLADEINRASPRTQAALLEAMQEKTVTVNGIVYPLPIPFMVLATQNPLETEGTFPLPEAQLDRFLMHSLIFYPLYENEIKIFQEHAKNSLFGEMAYNVDTLKSFFTEKISLQMILAVIEKCKEVSVSEEIIEIVCKLVRSTRPSDELCPDDIKPLVYWGASSRAGITLINVSRVFSIMQGSEVLRWVHIKRFIKPVLRHRIKLTSESLRENLSEDDIIDKIIVNFENRYDKLIKGL